MIVVDVLILIVCTLIGLAVGFLIGHSLTGTFIGFAVSVGAILIVDIFYRRKIKATIRDITRYQS